MTEAAQFAVLGIGMGAVYALLASGLVLVYQGSGVLNFGHGALAMLAGYLYYQLNVVARWGALPAFLVVVAAMVPVGAFISLAVMRPLRNAAGPTRIIATLGILVTIEGACALIWGPIARTATQFLPLGLWRIGNVVIPQAQAALLAIGVFVTVALWVAFRYTNIGLAMRATAQNQRAAAALGWSPGVLALMAWVLGTVMAGIAGILILPILAVQVADTPLIVVPAMAAALVGGFVSYPVALGGALLLGIAQSEASAYQGNSIDLADALPVLLIVFLLVIRGTNLPVRGQIAALLPKVGTGRITWWALIPAVVGGVCVILLTLPVTVTDAVSVTFGWGMIILSITILLGYAGQLSLGQFAVAGVGALIAGRLVDAGVPFIVAVPAAVIASIFVSLVFALPALRTRGVALAVVTLGLATAVTALVFGNTFFTGGPGGTTVPGQSLLGWSIDPLTHSNRYAVVVFVLFIICCVGVANMRRGSSGRQLIAVRSNERAASALGISVFRAKMYAFAAAAAVAAVGGVMLGFSSVMISYDNYDPYQGVLAVAYGVIGGIGFVAGSVPGAQLAPGGLGQWLSTDLWSAGGYWLVLIGGISLPLILILDENGLVSQQIRQARAIARVLHRLVRPLIRARKASEGVVVTTDVMRLAPMRLDVFGLSVRFGGVVAVDDVSLSVSPGEVVGLIGPNGAGKTTFIDAVTGLVRPSAGRMQLNDVDISGWPAHRRARAGLSRSFQSLELFEDLTVRDNLRVAADTRAVLPYLTDIIAPRTPPLSAVTQAAVDEFELGELLDKLPGEIPYGHRRLVGIARAIAIGPSLLLLDEPASGLSATETRELAEIVGRIARGWGLGVLVVEHEMSFVMPLCDRIVVLDFGRKIAEGTPAEVQANPAVISAYLGTGEPAAAGDPLGAT